MQRLRQKFWIGFWLLAIGLFLFPINNLSLRILTILFGMFGYGVIIYFFCKHKFIITTIILMSVAIVGFFIWPGKPIEAKNLRLTYLKSLRSYESTHYVWGGENKLGIDCSGLVRAGFIKANFEEGLKTFNPKLVRSAASLWWYDCSAKSLGEQYRGLTKKIIYSTGINSLDHSQILPGDMAVTIDGMHVLAFLGGDEWIEADPTFGKVVIVKAPSKDNPWLNEPVQIVRWTELETN